MKKKSKPATTPIKTRSDRERRLRQAARVARILSVLNLIQSRGRWTAKAIADELESSVRTVYRDLEVLELVGVPWYLESQDNTIRVRSEFRSPTLHLTDEELLGQAVATALTQSPGLDVSPGARPTTRKLAAVSSESTKQRLDDAGRLIEVLDLKLSDHRKHHEMIRTVQTAPLSGRQISGQYASPYESAPLRVRLHPYRLCLVKHSWYIIGRPTDQEAPLTYRVTRFKSLRMLEEPASIPADFNVQTYFGNAWSVYRGTPTVDVEIWFTPAAGKLVTETHWHHTQHAINHADGSVSLKFRIDGIEEIAHWILSWTGRAKVIQPTALRDLVLAKLHDAIKMHEVS